MAFSHCLAAFALSLAVASSAAYSYDDYNTRRCTATDARCAGAPGKPFIKYAPCCDHSKDCLPKPKASKAEWGRFCISPPSRPTKKCYSTNQRCMGAPGKPYVEYHRCCKAGDSCQKVAGHWGGFCRPSSASPSKSKDKAPHYGYKPQSDDDKKKRKCYDTGMRCMGETGYPYVQYYPCCKPQDSCVKSSTTWGSFCASKAGYHSKKPESYHGHSYPTQAPATAAPSPAPAPAPKPRSYYGGYGYGGYYKTKAPVTAAPRTSARHSGHRGYGYQSQDNYGHGRGYGYGGYGYGGYGHGGYGKKKPPVSTKPPKVTKSPTTTPKMTTTKTASETTTTAAVTTTTAAVTTTTAAVTTTTAAVSTTTAAETTSTTAKPLIIRIFPSLSDEFGCNSGSEPLAREFLQSPFTSSSGREILEYVFPIRACNTDANSFTRSDALEFCAALVDRVSAVDTNTQCRFIAISALSTSRFLSAFEMSVVMRQQGGGVDLTVQLLTSNGDGVRDVLAGLVEQAGARENTPDPTVDE